jgi:hypothetical protein
MRGDLLGERHGGIQQLVVRYDLGHQADAFGLLRIDAASREYQAHGVRQTDGLDPEPAAAMSGMSPTRTWRS